MKQLYLILPLMKVRNIMMQGKTLKSKRVRLKLKLCCIIIKETSIVAKKEYLSLSRLPPVFQFSDVISKA